MNVRILEVNMPAQLKAIFGGKAGHESGSSTVELAIIFPILMILFVGSAELGRMFYTYTTLAKATKVGARYLSVSRNAVNGTATEITNAKNAARNMVVYGCADRTVSPCSTASAIVSGLTTANVNICDNFSGAACNPVIPAGTTKYFRVEIQNFTYRRGVWNLATKTGAANSTYYFDLKPSTEMRYIP
jgi:Flp pilus assembly protein TadG